MQEQGVAQPEHLRARAQPLPEHAVGPEQRRVRAAQPRRGFQILRVDVAQVAVQHHGLVVAQHDVHRATGGRGLLLQAVQQPQGFRDLRAAVEHVATDHQRAVAEAPAFVLVDDPVRAQQSPQQAELAVDVRQRGHP